MWFGCLCLPSVLEDSRASVHFIGIDLTLFKRMYCECLKFGRVLEFNTLLIHFCSQKDNSFVFQFLPWYLKVIFLQFFTDPTRIITGPTDAVPKKGSTIHLSCRVKYDPTLKLTVTWLKDDSTLYIGNRFVPPLSFLPYSLNKWKDYLFPCKEWINHFAIIVAFAGILPLKD